MRRLLAIAVVLGVASVARANGLPPGSCPAGTYWTRSYTVADDPDYLGSTSATYSITAPCFVTFDTDFVITAKVQDTRCTTGTVGTKFKITDTLLDGSNATSIIAGIGSGLPGSGVGNITVTSADGITGRWSQAVTQHYRAPMAVTNHAIQLSVVTRVKNDCVVPVMGGLLAPNLVGTTTYDPLPPGSTDPGPVSTGDPTPVTTTQDPGSGSTTTPGGSGNNSGNSSPGASATDAGGCGSSGVTPALLGLAALVAAGWPRRRAARR